MKRRFLEDCLAKGMSLEAIGELAGRHPSTVGCWLKKHGLSARGQTKYARRGALGRDELKALVENGSTVAEIANALATFERRRHGVTEFILEGRGYYRCKRCRAAAGACALCGYRRWIGALQFRHLDPGGKEFHIGHRGYSRSLARSRAEAQKCVLLCANCHAEVEGGFATLPLDSCPDSDESVGVKV